MSRNIIDVANNRANVRPGERYGIEVEAEGCPIELVPEMRWSTLYRSYWSPVADGSLRNGGVEFLSKPLGRTAVRHAINALWPYFAEGRMRPSVRTGIHIHCSFLGLNTDHVLRVLRHYALVEPILFNYVGAEREENIYCIPWYRSPSEAETAYTWLKSWEPGNRGVGSEEPCKYSALYVGPLTNFGTIEFRHAPTWTDADTMFRWWQLTQALFRTHTSEYDVMEKFTELGPVGFARHVFPFEWLKAPTEAMFDDADVETVCSLLDEPRMITATEWGRAPELAGPGVATVQPRIARVMFEEDEDRRVQVRAAVDRVMDTVRRREPPTLTVNAPEELSPPGDHDDDNDREEF